MKKGVIYFGLIFIFTAILFAGKKLYFEPVQNQVFVSNQKINKGGDTINAAEKNVLQKQEIAAEYGKLPINFEPNQGQTDEQVKFLARGHGYTLFLTGNEAVLNLEKRGKTKAQNKNATVKMQLEGANDTPKAFGLDETGGKSNYFIGNDPEKWQIDVPNYKQVKYEQIYTGIDLVYYGNGQQLEYDFLVEPNANPEQIKLKFDGVKSAKIDEQSGDLLLETNAGTIRQHKPFVYQEINGERHEIASSYKLEKDKSLVSFNLAKYDESKKLVIDPILAYGSYLGGNIFDEGRSITVDAQGNAYVVGTAASRNFPTTVGTVKPELQAIGSSQAWYDAFVTKVNPNGTAIVFSTYFGGNNGSETGSGVAVDAQGNVFLSGNTISSDFPLVNAYSSVYNNIDMNFAAKLNSTGSAIIYSTYIGTSGGSASKIAVNQTTGEAVFAGTTGTPNFPTTPGAFREKLCDAPPSCQGIFYSGSYVVRFNATGGAVFSTLFPAGLNDVALDANDNVIVGGTAAATFPTTPGAFQITSSGGVEGIVAKLNPSGSALVFGTFLGGGLQSDRVKGVAVDGGGNIYATGQTENTGFPTTTGAFDQTFNGGEDGFLTKFNPQGTALVYSTFFGGAGKDEPFAVGIGTDNSAFVAGETRSPNTFPLKNSINGTNGTIFVTRFAPDATALVFSTILGQGGAYDLAVDNANGVYVTGHTTSIVVTPDSFQPMKGEATSTSSSKDAFVIKLAPTDETVQHYNISGTVTDPTQSGDYSPIVVTVTGTVNRSIVLPYGSGNGIISYFFGNLPAGGNYTVKAKKLGYETEPESVVFNNLGANQFADFTILNNGKPVGEITSPVQGTTYSAPATITIQATASDPDGHAIQKVDFVAYNSDSGSVPLGTDTTAPYEFTWENVPQGTWTLYAIPTDSLGLRGESNFVHVFVVDSTGLSVSISSPTEGQSFIQGDNVPLSAAVSSSVSVLEFYDQDNNLVGRRTSAPWSTTWRITETGNYTVKAKVFNSQGESITSDPVGFVVNAINHQISGRVFDFTANAPVPNITVNLTSQSNPNITATTTTDSNGVYQFTDLGTTPNDGVTITPVSDEYNFEPPSKNIGFLGFINWTSQNFSATRITEIDVAMTSPTQGQTFTAPATINLAANATSGAGAITKVEFYRQQGAQIVLLATDTTAPYEHQLTNVGAGNNLFYFARATDSTGAVQDSAAVGVTVNAPVTTINLLGDITSPNGGWMPGITVRLTGTANGNPINQTSVTNFFGVYGFGNLPVGGNYTVTPEAIGGMTFTPPSFTITNATADNIDVDFVADTFNQAPTVQINSPTDGGTYSLSSAIPFNVTASDADGTVAHLTVTAVSPTQSFSVGQSNNGTFSAPWQPSVPGDYTIWATARDNGGLSTSVSINITVTPSPPVSISGRIVNRDSQGIEGATVELRNYTGAEEQEPIATATTDANGNYTIPNVATFNNYLLKVSKLNYTFSPQQRIYFNLAAAQTNADYTGTLSLQPSDFDGDAQSDVAVWRPSTGVWHVMRSGTNAYEGIAFGADSLGDIAVPGNYDGDEKIDIAVYRKGTWYIYNSSNHQIQGITFGAESDKPMPGDYDGDGKTDVAVFRPKNGTWYVLRSSDNQVDAAAWGHKLDIQLVGDYDGDGKADMTVFRPSNGTWYIRQSSNGAMQAHAFGAAGDVPVVGDFDGDRKTDVCVFRPSNGVWYQLQSSDGAFKYFVWGAPGDVPVAGDYDLDGKTDYAVFRKTDGAWHIYRSKTNSPTTQMFGANGDVPIPAALIR